MDPYLEAPDIWPDFHKKQSEVLESDASLIELDLLRTGERLLTDPEVQVYIASVQPPPDYLVLVSRAWQRSVGLRAVRLFPILLAEALPVIPVPLRQGQEELPLDLQYVFSRAYDGGPYRRGAVDYDRPPEPPLVGEQAAWADQRLRESFKSLAPDPSPG
jgi:hypothetical protein